ncbi:MAG TPA: biotin/lipoyl-containing protein [Candidatus Dormibacteraeota bacterium]|nr:biotin/lipoyl-containing protein [Candidatus Dormibacteraeota bacterium]
MTERDDELAQVERAARELVPLLSERLAKHGLGELEVRMGSLRVRVAAAPSGTTPDGGPRIVATGSAPRAEREPSAQAAQAAQAAPAATVVNHGVTSPAVGFFIYADGLGPGLTVEKGDGLGHVEMLGVRHDVRAPRRGTVRNLVTEAGEPVEFGQLLIELEPTE